MRRFQWIFLILFLGVGTISEAIEWSRLARFVPDSEKNCPGLFWERDKNLGEFIEVQTRKVLLTQVSTVTLKGKMIVRGTVLIFQDAVIPILKDGTFSLSVSLRSVLKGSRESEQQSFSLSCINLNGKSSQYRFSIF